MERNIALPHSFLHPEVEAQLQSLDGELTQFATLSAKEDAGKGTAMTETVYDIRVAQPIVGNVQAVIDHIRKILLPTSLLFDTVAIDQQARKKVEVKSKEKTDKLLHRGSLMRKLAAIIIDPLKKKYAKWLLPLAIVIGMGDGSLAFTSFRHGGYTLLMALVSAIAIGAVISQSHLLYAGWIKQATTYKGRIGRILLVLGISFIFFGWIGNLRSNAVNNVVSIAIDSNTVSAASSPHLNGWAIAFISFFLFAAILFLSLILWRNKKERLEQEEYDRIEKEIAVVDSELAAIDAENTEIEAAATKQKREARIIYDYATSSIRKAKGIGRNAISLYKRTYLRYSNDIMPDFFSDTKEPTYDESFQFVKPVKTELV